MKIRAIPRSTPIPAMASRRPGERTDCGTVLSGSIGSSVASVTPVTVTPLYGRPNGVEVAYGSVPMDQSWSVWLQASYRKRSRRRGRVAQAGACKAPYGGSIPPAASNRLFANRARPVRETACRAVLSLAGACRGSRRRCGHRHLRPLRAGVRKPSYREL